MFQGTSTSDPGPILRLLPLRTPSHCCLDAPCRVTGYYYAVVHCNSAQLGEERDILYTYIGLRHDERARDEKVSVDRGGIYIFQQWPESSSDSIVYRTHTPNERTHERTPVTRLGQKFVQRGR